MAVSFNPCAWMVFDRARVRHAPGRLALSLLLPMLITPANADIDWTKILRGEIIVERIENADGLDGIRTAFAVAASRDRVWSVLTDYDNFEKIFPRITRIDVLEQDESGATLEYWTDAVITNLNYVLRRSYVEPGRKLTWQRVSGDLERIEGSWQIIEGPDPDISALIFDSYLDVGSKVMTWGARLGAEYEAQRMAIQLRNWIEGVISIQSTPPDLLQLRASDPGR